MAMFLMEASQNDIPQCRLFEMVSQNIMLQHYFNWHDYGSGQMDLLTILIFSNGSYRSEMEPFTSDSFLTAPTAFNPVICYHAN